VIDPLDTIDAPASPPAHRLGIAVLSLAGLLVAVYLLLYKINVIGTIACGTGACESVQASPWAVFLGIPVPAWGVAGYLVILLLALALIQPSYMDNRTVSLLLVANTTFAFAFSAYLTWIEAYRIQAWCRWCVVSAIIATLIFLLSLRELPFLLRRKHHEP
jgi:uncharacterized membrane protein